jgi:hypothetical protein
MLICPALNRRGYLLVALLRLLCPIRSLFLVRFGTNCGCRAGFLRL